jgi:hypothetical protein
MKLTIEIDDGCDIVLGLSSTDPDDLADAQRIIERHRQKRQGVPTALLQHVAKRKVDRVFVKPLAAAMTANAHYDAARLAEMLGHGWSARRVASKLCVLGRPEKRFKARIFERHPDGYSITAEMKAAVLAA